MDHKQIRRTMGSTGWIMLLYSVLMFACELVSMLSEILIRMIGAVSGGDFSYETMFSLIMSSTASG